MLKVEGGDINGCYTDWIEGAINGCRRGSCIGWRCMSNSRPGPPCDPVNVFSLFLSSASSVFADVCADLEAPPPLERESEGQKEDWSYLWVAFQCELVVAAWGGGGRVERGASFGTMPVGWQMGMLLVNG
jgi:hypothetical protein